MARAALALLLLASAACAAASGYGTPAWTYRAGAGPCNASSVVLDVDALSSAPQLVAAAVRTFRACGLVALRGAFAAAEADRLREDTERVLAPALASRQRVRDELKRVLRRQARARRTPAAAPSLAPFPAQESWAVLADEPLFGLGGVYRERADGRIDIQLPLPIVPRAASGPQAELERVAARRRTSEVLANRHALAVLGALLGKDFALKSLSVMYSLPAAQQGDRVCDAPQHWHRDVPLLFEDDEQFHLKGVHARDGGVQTPPYLLNVFVPLVDLAAENGPTEFVLGSHTWGDRWSEFELDPAEPGEELLATVPRGTIVIADYRTVHRGTVNRSGAPRPVAMIIAGRQWAFDTLNYGLGLDFGGIPLRPESLLLPDPHLLRRAEAAPDGPRESTPACDLLPGFTAVPPPLVEYASSLGLATLPPAARSALAQLVQHDMELQLVAAQVLGPCSVPQRLRQRMFRAYVDRWMGNMLCELELERARESAGESG